MTALRTDIASGWPRPRLPQFQAQVTELENRLENLRQVLPEEKDVADILRRIQTLATQSNLTIQRFQPGGRPAEALRRDSDRLEAEGTYHNLGPFFDRISKFPRIINVSEISIKAKEPPEPNATISPKCVATTFVLQEGAAGGRDGTVPKQPSLKPRDTMIMTADIRSSLSSARCGLCVAARRRSAAAPADDRAGSSRRRQRPPGADAGARAGPGRALQLDPQGRRDPFVSLLARGSDPRRGDPAGGPAGPAHLRSGGQGHRSRSQRIHRDGSGAGHEDLHRSHGRQADGRNREGDHGRHRRVLAGRQRSALDGQAEGSPEDGSLGRRRAGEADAVECFQSKEPTDDGAQGFT